MLEKDKRHSHFWIEDGKLFESYHTIRGLRYRYRMDADGMPDTDKCSDEMISYIWTAQTICQSIDFIAHKDAYTLSVMHQRAIKEENYELCAAIQAEINARIDQGTISHAFMQGFRRYNAEEKKFEGPYRMDGMNGLFDKYIEKYPTE